MNLEKSPITLIAFDTHPLKDILNEVLVRFGFKNIDVLGYNDLPNVDNARIAIFLVSQRKEMWEIMRSTFRRLRMMPSLCVIQSPEKKLNHELLEYCNDFLCWPCLEKELLFRLKRLHNEFRSLSEQSIEEEMFQEFIELNMVGSSPPFQDVLTRIKKIACYDMPVLIEGETGTGKEVAARAIHYLSERRGYPFIPVNCGAIPDGIIESELFGHEKGAFTDAKTRREGLISQAEGGTLFLDEIEAFSPKAQVVLLRFLQDQEYRRLGSSQTKQSDVRIIAASNSTLSDMVDNGAFRQDLLYRLNIMPIKIPSLSQRTSDIEILAEHFLDRYRLQYNLPKKFLHPNTIQYLNSYDWPGNVRELENMIHRELLLANGPSIKLGIETLKQKDRRENIFDRRQGFLFECTFNEAKSKVVDQFENRYLNWLIKESNGNVTQAAKRAGKERRSLGKLLKKHGIAKDGIAFS